MKEKLELARVKIELPIPYISVLDLVINQEKNKHGRLQLRLLIKGETDNSSIIALKDAPVKVNLPDGTCIFSGVITGAKAEIETEYKELVIEALTHSCKADLKKNSRTFQDSSKTDRKSVV